MSGKNFDIFISYRRSDGEEIAAKINETLKGNHYRCFFDFESLTDGRFDDRIEKAIEDAPVFIALLTPHYLERPKKDGEKELSEEKKKKQEKDWVIREIECAIKNNKKIIPINYNKRFVDYPESISEEIKEGLGGHNFAVVSSGQQYSRDMDALMKKWIGNTVPPPTEKTQGKANIEVKSDANCDILKTGEVIATVAKGGYNILKLSQGRHRLVFRSNEFSDIEQEAELEVKSNLADDIFDVKLAKRVNRRRKKIEREEKRYAKLQKQKLDNQKRREERNRYWEETLRPLFRKIGNWFVIALAVIAVAVAGTWCIKNCKGFTETATETAVETKTETQTEAPIVANEDKFNEYKDSIRQAEEKKQAELDAQKAKERELKEEQDRKRREAEKKRQAEEKKKQDEEQFNEYKKQGNYNFNMLLKNSGNNYYKKEAMFYYKRALEYKEDATIRERYNKLKSED